MQNGLFEKTRSKASSCLYATTSIELGLLPAHPDHGRYNALIDAGVDLLQPDVMWMGGPTEFARIVALASARGVKVRGEERAAGMCGGQNAAGQIKSRIGLSCDGSLICMERRRLNP